MTTRNGHQSGWGRSGDEALGYLALCTAATAGTLWTATWIANGFRAPAGGIMGFGRGLWNLAQSPGEPGPAWGLSFPAGLWWTIVVVEILGLIALAVYLHHGYVGRVGSKRRRRLGVDTRARLAEKRDLRSLHVDGPVPGRLIVGEAHGKLLATEDRRSPGKDKKHQGDKACIAIIGPQRSGKSANVISGILDWSGPAILSSVRGDLLQHTLARRSQVGEVRVWDPAGVTNHETGHWSPLRGAGTVTGAMRAANGLAAAMPRDGASNMDFFSAFARQLLWPLLWVAANTGGTMSDVIGWTMSMDKPQGDDEGEVAHHLRVLLGDHQPEVRDGAVRATEALASIWQAPGQTAGSAYATITNQIAVFQDPAVSRACDAEANIDLGWLTSGANTLYLSAPTGEQERLSTPIMGLVRDLLDQAYEREIRDGPVEDTVLLVLDEIGQTPVTWLPEVSATAAGTGLLLCTIWQSKAQIDAGYNRKADVILANHLTKIFYSGISDRSTLEYVAQVTGQEEVTTTSHNRGPSLLTGVRSSSQQTRDVKLVPADVLRQVPVGEGLLLHGNLPPAHVNGRRWWLDRRLSKLAQATGSKRPAGQVDDDDPDDLAAELAAMSAQSPVGPALGFYGSIVRK